MEFKEMASELTKLYIEKKLILNKIDMLETRILNEAQWISELDMINLKEK